MSASNWGTCPQCKKTQDERIQKVLVELGEQYGKVPVERYKELSARADVKLAELRESMEGSTLREDWELYTNVDGVFSVRYSCSCDVCSLSYRHQFSEDVLKESNGR